ncbi:MAG TPA: manganese-binding transcriptional regulator MntR [Phycisphaerales bacterium]|nr:manganese-binding transcriptional regulator MntR [Phycisphaerales bacterium]
MPDHEPKRSSSVREADRHERVREAHALETAEDYAETIAQIIAESGRCRVVDLSRHFGVSHVTVSRTIGRLVRDGYVMTEPYRPIELTAEGRKLARLARHRHETVVRFLLALGLDAQTAEFDAEGIEHHVSPKTLRAFGRFADQNG